MPFFIYKAIDDNGEIVKGQIEGNDLDLVYNNISSAGLHILNIQKSSSLSSLYLKKAQSWGIKGKDIIEFAKNLSVMLRSGLPLITSISDIAESVENKKFRSKLLDIKSSIELGSSFSVALSQQQDIFPEIFVNLIAVGEETGRLDESLTDIAIHLQRMEDLKSAIIRALMYPVFALVGTTGALLFWLIYVLPKISGLFTSMDIELPPLTQALITASDFSQKNWYVFIVFPVVFYMVYTLLARHHRTKYYVDAIKLRLPVIKLVLHNKLLALFAEQLRILVAAGVTIDRAFDIMIEVVNNDVFKRALIDTKDNIMLGSKISDALKKHVQLFPNIVVRMISIGETTGNLNEQLENLSTYFLDKLDDISEKMGKLIEPIIIVVIGGIFVVIILGLLSPIYDLISGITG
jgi:type II secretory pathway component PulF